MILADRLNRIIEERQISKAEFARWIGVTPQYVLLLTGNAKARPESIKPALAKLIALEFDCDYEWLLHGKEPENKPTINVHTCEGYKEKSDHLFDDRIFSCPVPAFTHWSIFVPLSEKPWLSALFLYDAVLGMPFIKTGDILRHHRHAPCTGLGRAPCHVGGQE